MIEIPDLHGIILNANGDYETRKYLESKSGRTVFNLGDYLDLNQDEYALRSRYFDFIVSYDILGKLYNPAHYLSECFKALRIDGTFIFTTPVKPIFDNYEYFHYFDERRLRNILFDTGWKLKNLEKRKVERKLNWNQSIPRIINNFYGKYWYGEAGVL